MKKWLKEELRFTFIDDEGELWPGGILIAVLIIVMIILLMGMFFGGIVQMVQVWKEAQ